MSSNAPLAAKNATSAPGMMSIPPSTSAAVTAICRGSKRSPARQRNTSTATVAITSTASSTLVFIETANVAPSTTPNQNARRPLNSPPVAITSASSQSATQRSSVRNSAETKKNVGNAPVSAAAQSPARIDQSRDATL